MCIRIDDALSELMNFIVPYVTCNNYTFRWESGNIVGTSKIRSNYYYTCSLIMLLLVNDSSILFSYIISYPLSDNIYLCTGHRGFRLIKHLSTNVRMRDSGF